MLRSLFSGVAGLQNHQVRMDVVGNNIANVNTTGFKKGRVNFQDLLYQQMAGASKPNGDVGGVNPKEIGLGMSIASVDTIHTQGSLQTTGVMTDLAVQGNGFFVLKKGEQTMYTRARELVWLRYHSELASETIARQLEWKEPAVRVALSKARAFLRDCVQGQMAKGQP